MMGMVVEQPVNFIAGWIMILAGFLSGAALGIWFYRDDFLGGYTAFRRRILRLGHIALAELGTINVVYSLSPWPAPGSRVASAASLLLVLGGILMPLICFLTSWRPQFRRLFPVSVIVLVVAVVLTLAGAHP